MKNEGIDLETGQATPGPPAPRSASQTPKERSMSSVMDALDREGFTEHFTVCDGRLTGLNSGTRFDPDDVVIRCVERFEGISDPDDMCVVYGIEAIGGIRGTLTDAFGVYSDSEVSCFVDKVECRIEAKRDA
jgi:hypothetical protein